MLAPLPFRTLIALGLAGLLSACVHGAADPATPIEVGVIALNDFHGALEPPGQSVVLPAPDGGDPVPVPAGGAAWLASAVDMLKARHPHSVVVAAGDLTSASQLASSLFLDEPAVGVMNRIGLAFNAVGNHEFDRGWQELVRLQTGGCEKWTRLEPCRLEPFKGASYRYLAASTRKADGETLFPATGLKRFETAAGPITLGFIGLSLKAVPALVSPDRLKGLTFGDEAEAINREVPRLKAAGADAVIVLIHQGGRTRPGSDPSGCDEFTGDIAPILDRLNPGVDVVVSGHTHWAYVCERAAANVARPLLLTSAGSYGQLVTDLTLRFDPRTRRLLTREARNVIVQSRPYASARGLVAGTALVPRFQPRADVAAYVQRYVDAVAGEIARPAGHLSAPAMKMPGPVGGPLGNLIADSQLAATKGSGAELAFTNPFGIRASLNPAPDGTVTFGQLYAVQPFGNELVTLTLTGAQIAAVIEQGLDDADARQVLSPSANVRFAYDLARPPGQRLVSLTVDGKAVDAERRYRVTVNSFLAEGGDYFTTFRQGTGRTSGGVDLDAMEAWLSAMPMRALPAESRTADVSP